VVGRLAAAELARPRNWPSRVWSWWRALMRRHRVVRLAVVGVVLGAIAVRTVQLVARPGLCRGAPEKIAGIWDPATKAQARRAFAKTGKSYAAEAFWSVNKAIEAYLDEWTAMYTEACEATHVRG